MTEMESQVRHGVELFNSREFFESHEALEAVWMRAEPRRRFFLQALIHFAVSFHHNGQGNIDGAIRQLDKGLRKLAGYLPECEGVDTLQLYQDGIACYDRLVRGRLLEDYPSVYTRWPAAVPTRAR